MVVFLLSLDASSESRESLELDAEAEEVCVDSSGGESADSFLFITVPGAGAVGALAAEAVELAEIVELLEEAVVSEPELVDEGELFGFRN